MRKLFTIVFDKGAGVTATGQACAEAVAVTPLATPALRVGSDGKLKQ